MKTKLLAMLAVALLSGNLTLAANGQQDFLEMVKSKQVEALEELFNNDETGFNEGIATLIANGGSSYLVDLLVDAYNTSRDYSYLVKGILAERIGANDRSVVNRILHLAYGDNAPKEALGNLVHLAEETDPVTADALRYKKILPDDLVKRANRGDRFALATLIECARYANEKAILELYKMCKKGAVQYKTIENVLLYLARTYDDQTPIPNFWFYDFVSPEVLTLKARDDRNLSDILLRCADVTKSKRLRDSLREALQR